jgi:hypothetical protein
MALTPPALAREPSSPPVQDFALPEDFDRVAVVVDWLDACRSRDLNTLLDLYAVDARLECNCDSVKVHRGRTELEAYWRPRLDSPTPVAFGVEEITPGPDGVVLDYLSYEGKPVRIHFRFNDFGKIMQTRCEPAGTKT